MTEQFKKSLFNISYRHNLAYNIGLIINNDNKDPINQLINNLSDIDQMVKVEKVKIISFYILIEKQLKKSYMIMKISFLFILI